MKIEKLNIASFGKLKNTELELADGINIISGDNEAGKSTVSSFVKYMLYGFSGSKTRSVSTNDKLHFMPWDGSAVSGSAVIHCKEASYRIERQNGSKSTLKVISLPGGKECNFGKEPGEELLGTDESAFTKMAFIGQNDVCSCSDSVSGLSDAVQNIVFAADETVDIEKARKKLTDYKNFFRNRSRKTGKCFELEEKIRALRYDFDENSELHKTLLAAEAKLAETRRKIKSNEEKAAELEKELANIDGYFAKQTLDKVLAAKLALEKASDDLRSARAELTFDGAVCDSKTLSELSSAYERYRTALEMLENSEKNLEIAQNEKRAKAESDELLSKCADKSGKDLLSLGEKLRSLMSSAKVFGITAIVSGVLALALGGAAICFLDLLPEYIRSPFVFAVPAVLVLLFAVFLAVSVSKRIKKKKLLAEYGFLSADELFEFINELPEVQKKILEIEAQERVFEDDIAAKREVMTEARGRLMSVLSRFGASEEDAEELMSELVTRISALSEKENEYKRCESAYEAYLSTNDMHALAEAAQHFTHEPARDRKTVMREYEFFTKANANLAELEKQYIRQSASPASIIRKPSEILAERQATEALLAECCEKADAAELALTALEDACGDLKNGISPLIAKKASELFSLFTDGKYPSLEISSEFGLGISEGGIIRDGGYLSAGTRDAAYLALRISLCETLFREKPVLVFDEVFAHFDDKRLAASLEVLRKLSSEYQILIFTCHSREKKALGGVNVIEI